MGKTPCCVVAADFFFVKKTAIFDAMIFGSSIQLKQPFTNRRFQAMISPIKIREEISESHGRENFGLKGHNEAPSFFR